MGSDESLLAQQLDGRIDSAYYLQTAPQVRLAVIPSVDKVKRDLDTFAFVAYHLFSTGGRHMASVLDILCLV